MPPEPQKAPQPVPPVGGVRPNQAAAPRPGSTPAATIPVSGLNPIVAIEYPVWVVGKDNKVVAGTRSAKVDLSRALPEIERYRFGAEPLRIGNEQGAKNGEYVKLLQVALNKARFTASQYPIEVDGVMQVGRGTEKAFGEFLNKENADKNRIRKLIGRNPKYTEVGSMTLASLAKYEPLLNGDSRASTWIISSNDVAIMNPILSGYQTMKLGDKGPGATVINRLVKQVSGKDPDPGAKNKITQETLDQLDLMCRKTYEGPEKVASIGPAVGHALCLQLWNKTKTTPNIPKPR